MISVILRLFFTAFEAVDLACIGSFSWYSLSVKIINDHIEHRRQERYQNPDRFNVKPTLGEQCVRRPPPQPTQPTFEDSTLADSALHSQANPEELPPMSREASVQFKEIEVNQMDNSALYNMPIQGY